MEKLGLSNTNKLIKNYSGATGLKTGSTSLALYNLSASATRDGLSLIAVIMKAPSTKVRFAEAEKLLNYGFNNFAFEKFGEKGDIVSTVNIYKGVKSTIPAVLSEGAGVLVAKGNNKNVEQSIVIDENISAPITKGQKLGEVKFVLDGETLANVDVVATEDVNKIDIFGMTKKIYKEWFKLLR